VADQPLITYGILLLYLFFVAAVMYSRSLYFLLADVNIFFASEVNNAYFCKHF